MRKLLKSMKMLLLVAAGLCVGANSAWAAEGDVIYSNDFSTKDYSDFATWLGTGKQPSGYSYAQLGRCGTFSIVDGAWVINAQTSKNNGQVDNGNYGTLIEGITTATSTTNYVLEFDITLAVLNHYAGNAIFEISGEDNKTILCLYAKHTRSGSTAGSTSYGYIVGGNNAFSTKEATYTTRTNTEGSWGDGTQNDIATVSGTTGSKTYHIILDAQTNGLAKLTIKEGESKVVDEADVNISANKGIKYLYMSTRNYDDSYITPVSVNSITIDNLSIVEGAASTAATADYTVKFVTTINDAETEIKSSDTRTGIVNSSISLTNADKNTIWYENKKYIYSSDNASSSTIANDNSTVVKVMFAEAPSYTYSVVDNLGNTLASGSSYKGENVVFYVPYYAFKDNKFYTSPSLNSGTLSYGQGKITAIAENTNITVTYTEEENSNVVFFSEAENLTGIKAFSDNYTQIRMSNGQGGYYESQTAFVTLPAGVYTLTSATRQGKTYFYSGTVGEGIEIGTVESSGSVVTTTSKLFTLTKETDIYTSVGSTSAYFDYVIIRKISDVSATITAAGWATLYTPCALNFAAAEPKGLEAYTATLNGSTVTLTKVDDVPANTGVVLKGGANTYSIPVIVNSSTDRGDLKGSTTEAKEATEQAPIYILKLNNNDEAQFMRATSGSLAAGKAYLNGGQEAKALTVVFANDPTGIANVNAAETVQPVKRIVNGQLVIEKNGKRYNAAGAEL